MKPQVLLCRWGKPSALFSVWMPHMGPLNRLCCLPPCSGVLAEQAEACIQLWVGLGFRFSVLGQWEKQPLKPVKIFVCCLNSNSSQPTLQVSGLNRATGFAQQTISSTHSPLWAQVLPDCTDCRHCLQPFWLEGPEDTLHHRGAVI